MVATQRCFHGISRRGPSMGTGDRFGHGSFQASGVGCGPPGVGYYRYAHSTGLGTDVRTTCFSRGGPRQGPGSYPEDKAQQRGKAPPGAYTPLALRSEAVPTFGVGDRPRLGHRQDSPGAKYEIFGLFANPGNKSWDIKLGRGRPVERFPLPQGRMVNLRDSFPTGHGRRACSLGPGWRDDPAAKEQASLPGPGTYTIPSAWAGPPLPPSPGKRRPVSAGPVPTPQRRDLREWPEDEDHPALFNSSSEQEL